MLGVDLMSLAPLAASALAGTGSAENNCIASMMLCYIIQHVTLKGKLAAVVQSNPGNYAYQYELFIENRSCCLMWIKGLSKDLCAG